MVTKRIKALQVAGQTVHQIGIPVHWGFQGQAKKGFFCNNLTPYLGDANTQTPEFKAFLVNVEKDLSELLPHSHKPGDSHEERKRPDGNGTTGATEKSSWLGRILKGKTEEA
jgi:formate dehydrogenase major subunit